MVLLAINFFVGMAGGMKPLNLALVIGNGLLIIAIAMMERRR